MVTNKMYKQIDLQVESRGVEFPTKNLIVPSVSAYNSFFNLGLLINRRSCNFLNSKIYEVNSMENYKENERQDYYGYVYHILDQKRNKIYIGHKTGKVEDSLDYFGSGTIIKNIEKSRGTDFLKKTILGICSTIEELIDCETECKHFFNVLDRKYGYNIKERDTDYQLLKGKTYEEIHGIEKTKKLKKQKSKALKGKTYEEIHGVKKAKEIKEKISKSLKGKSYEEKYGIEEAKEIKGKISKTLKENPPFYGKTHTKETKQNISKTNKGRFKGMNNPFYGKTHTKETKLKMSELRKGHIPWNKGLTMETDERVRKNIKHRRIT